MAAGNRASSSLGGFVSIQYEQMNKTAVADSGC